ncbi:M43 family zinc metalloprotease [Aquimarina macrocephali]|uniref:M43 family zinc metalloprotease n=1 Tax=Aquimarina macrocephali TaxID=666563 RepID=UPI000462FE69|nr:M43 family zinc metalloprotease [Aquimarina macrocephali]
MTRSTTILTFLFSILFFNACDKTNVPTLPEEPTNVPPEEIISIPVVIHVINYSPNPFVISDEKIQSQIDVLNQDFRKLNPDHINTPGEFKHLVADVGVEFKLATIDPSENPTTGIIRTESMVVASDGHEDIESIEERLLYFSNKGGQDAWPNHKYLNIWIADYSNRLGNLGLPGYANPPGSDPRIDGVVMDPRVFGTLEPLADGHKFGRTATHEIGHWLNLKHIFAKDKDCESSDQVEDTPSQYESRTGHPVHPQFSCGSNDMFMNFMDYVNDNAMFMFTKGQKERMRELFNEGGTRRELYLNNKSNYRK